MDSSQCFHCLSHEYTAAQLIASLCVSFGSRACLICHLNWDFVFLCLRMMGGGMMSIWIHSGVLMSLKLFNNATQENVISSIGAENVSISTALTLSFFTSWYLMRFIFSPQIDVFAAVRPLPSLPAGSACAQVNCLLVFLISPLLTVVKWLLLYFPSHVMFRCASLWATLSRVTKSLL